MTTLSAEDLVHRIAVLEAEKAQMAAALEGVRDTANRIIDDLARSEIARDRLAASLKRCAGVLSGTDMSKSSLTKALESAREALIAAGAP